MNVPADPAAVSEARRFAERNLASWGLSSFVDTTILLISEVVTNAIIHGRSAAELTLILDRGVLRAEVRDSSEFVPRPRKYSQEATTGRGMLIVEALATAWGTEVEQPGKVVWFEMEVGESSLAIDLTPAEAASGGTVLQSQQDDIAVRSETPSGDDFPKALMLAGAPW